MSVTNKIISHVADTIKSAVCSYKGDTKKFYHEFYKYSSDSSKIFGLRNGNCNQLLKFELDSHVLGYISGVKIKQSVVFFKHISRDLNEKEKPIVHYHEE